MFELNVAPCDTELTHDKGIVLERLKRTHPLEEGGGFDLLAGMLVVLSDVRSSATRTLCCALPVSGRLAVCRALLIPTGTPLLCLQVRGDIVNPNAVSRLEVGCRLAVVHPAAVPPVHGCAPAGL